MKIKNENKIKKSAHRLINIDGNNTGLSLKSFLRISIDKSHEDDIRKLFGGYNKDLLIKIQNRIDGFKEDGYFFGKGFAMMLSSFTATDKENIIKLYEKVDKIFLMESAGETKKIFLELMHKDKYSNFGLNVKRLFNILRCSAGLKQIEAGQKVNPSYSYEEAESFSKRIEDAGLDSNGKDNPSIKKTISNDDVESLFKWYSSFFIEKEIKKPLDNGQQSLPLDEPVTLVSHLLPWQEEAVKNSNGTLPLEAIRIFRLGMNYESKIHSQTSSK